MKVAVIDLGTNTCNLLIAEVEKQHFNILHQSKQLVKLGDNKIKSNRISSAATRRVINALWEQQKIIHKFQVEKIRLVATSAIRSAENKVEFLDEVGSRSGRLIRIVSGEKEAELIFKGVLLAFEELENPSVILDIGGGSNELIVVHKNKMLWKESQSTGMARVINQFSLSDPLKPDEVKKLHRFFGEKHQAAFRQCKEKAVKTLIGCSGAFDTIADITDQINPGEKQRRHQEISLTDFYTLYEKITGSTHQQRLSMKGMDSVRVDLIVPAMVFIEQVIKENNISRIIQTDFALREGVLAEMM